MADPRGEGTFDLAAWLAPRRERIEALLAERAAGWRTTVPPRLAEAMAYSLLGGGKRLRPLLCLAAFEGCGGEGAGATAVALDAAVALEMIHTYSLVHDDLPAMDDDDLRRGRATCHRVYGEATAILVGDALLTEAFGVASAGAEGARGRLVGLLARAAGAAGMVGGQQLDLEMTGRLAAPAPGPGLPEVERVHRSKTGALLAASAEAGAVAAGAPAEQVRSLRSHGEALGLAFQIADDVLDVVGDAAAMGKAGRGDQAKGKPTYPALVGLEQARALARQARDAAVDAVAFLGERGAALRALADYSIERAG